MAVRTKDIKKLWGLAARRCSRPGCSEQCIRFLTDDPTVIGEMAHVIARRPSGPRGIATGGDDTYENLILLCPTHHTEIDKSPEGTFPAENLFAWKEEHEMRVTKALEAPKFATRRCLAVYVQRLLLQNYTVWKTCGPESDAAESNPLSNLAYIWSLRKLGTIIPNNRCIVVAIARCGRIMRTCSMWKDTRLLVRSLSTLRDLRSTATSESRPKMCLVSARHWTEQNVRSKGSLEVQLPRCLRVRPRSSLVRS